MVSFLTIVRRSALTSIVAGALIAAPALAVGPNQNPNATAKIVKPLTLTWVQDLDLGTIVLGTGTWAVTNIGITNQRVFITAPNVTLTNQNDNTKTLLLTVDNPGFVDLGNSGNSGITFGLGGSIGVSSTTTDGTYAGQFNVTVNY